MRPDELEALLKETLEDHRLSRGEKKALQEVFAEVGPDRRLLAEMRTRAFRIATEEIARPQASSVLGWLEEVVRLLQSFSRKSSRPAFAEAAFSPGDNCAERISALIGAARTSIEVCVFTITDDRIAGPLVEAHRRGVALRVLTDDEKADDRGSDVDRLRTAGIPLATDRSEYQMHHKFAVFDGALLLTGSYNWTRAASNHNQENILVTEDRRLVDAYAREFERLWSRFATT